MGNQESPTNHVIEGLKTGLRSVLNRNGFGFQYSVLRLISDLCDKGESSWLPETSEFPVQIKGSNTHIDFVLRRNKYVAANASIYMVCECKRVNPALGSWCFVRSPFTRRNRNPYDPWIIDYLEIRNYPTTQAKEVFASSMTSVKTELSYHIGMELKTNQIGDPCDQGKGAIDATVAQLGRGLAGFIETIRDWPEIVGSSTSALFIPVIFTTANLYTSDVDLSESDLITGNIELEKLELVEKPYLFFQYNLSPNLKHSVLSYSGPKADLGVLLESDFARTILVVNANGIEKFLQWTSQYDFW